jgi:hypothetical protein
MSAIAERAIVFYLTHSDVVDEVEMSQGQAHRLYSCPQCSSPLVIKEGELSAVGNSQGVLLEGDSIVSGSDQQDEEELVPC